MTAYHFPVWEKRTASPSETNRKTQGPNAPRALNPLCLTVGTLGYVPSGYSLGRLVLGTGGWQKVRWWAGREGVGGRKKPCLDTHEALAEVAPSSYTMPAGTVQGARCTEANQEVGLCAHGAGGSSSWRTPNSKFTAVTGTRGLRRKVSVCVGGSFLLIAPSFPLGLVDGLRTLSPAGSLAVQVQRENPRRAGRHGSFIWKAGALLFLPSHLESSAGSFLAYFPPSGRCFGFGGLSGPSLPPLLRGGG